MTYMNFFNVQQVADVNVNYNAREGRSTVEVIIKYSSSLFYGFEVVY